MRIYIFITLAFIFALALAASEYEVQNYQCTISACIFNLDYMGNDTFYGKPKNLIVKHLQVTI